jgi:ATP-dependent Lon protease
MRDEAEIKGHRRTYIGAMPGKFIQALKEVEVANPVIMLDEIDKIGASYQGDPASALLEVLDPEQNAISSIITWTCASTCRKVLFVCTANQLDTIPGPLLDRMETLRLAGYVAEEKLAIARNHLWPKQLERHGLAAAQLRINDAALKYVIESYCREAGVRNLEKQLARIMRKSIVSFVKSGDDRRSIVKRDIETLLGKPLFHRERPQRGIGVATGLAWTALGGATLPIESSRVHTLNRGFKLTGRLGDVMRESAEIAYSYVVSHLKDYGCDLEFFDTSMVHLHVPEGATPKDGPSAGITIATALVSLARKERVRRPLAMTGELTLTGQVLPVGGIREKVIARGARGSWNWCCPTATSATSRSCPITCARASTCISRAASARCSTRCSRTTAATARCTDLWGQFTDSQGSGSRRWRQCCPGLSNRWQLCSGPQLPAG